MAKTSAAATKPKAKGKQSKGKASAAGRPSAPTQPGVERRKNHPLRAKHGYMQVVLTNRVEKLGAAGQLVKVRPGFARNYLIPQGLATFATPHLLRMVEKHRIRLQQLEDARKADLMNLAAKIAQRSITIEANATPEGHLYGSVSAAMIAAALNADTFPIEEHHVQIEGPLKELGLYTISLNLGHDVLTEVKLWVVPTHAEEAPAS